MKGKIKFIIGLFFVLTFVTLFSFQKTTQVKAESDVITLDGNVLSQEDNGTYLIDAASTGALKINDVVYVEKVEELVGETGFNGSIALISTTTPNVYMVTSIEKGWNPTTDVTGVYESFKMRENATDFSNDGVVSKTIILTTNKYLGFTTLKSAGTGTGDYGYGVVEVENAIFNDGTNYGVSSFKALDKAIANHDGGYNEYFFENNGVHSVAITYTGNKYGYTWADNNNNYTYKCYVYDILTERPTFDATFSYDERLGEITIKQSGNSLYENGYHPMNGETIKLAKYVDYTYEVRPKTNVASTIDSSQTTDAYIESSLSNYWSNGVEQWGDCYATSGSSTKTWNEIGFSISNVYKKDVEKKYKVNFQEIVVVPTEEQEVTIIDDNVTSNETHVNGDTINVDYYSDITITLFTRIIKNANCELYLNDVLQEIALQEENGNYYFTLENVKKDFKIEFRYYKDGYRYNSIIYTIISAPINDFEGEDATNQFLRKYLATKGADLVTFLTNISYKKYGTNTVADNFVFNANYIDGDNAAFASNKSADYTVAIIGIQALEDGVLSIDVLTDGAPYTSSYGTGYFGYYCKNTFAYTGYASPTTFSEEDPESINKNDKGFIAGTLAKSCCSEEWFTFKVLLKKDEIIYLAYNAGSDYSAAGTPDKLAIRNVRFVKSSQTTVSYEVTNGSVNASIAGVSFTDSATCLTGQTISLNATPNAGYTFYYWLCQELDDSGNVVSSRLISRHQQVETTIDGKLKYIPCIEKDETYKARIGDTYYQTLVDAVNAAVSGDMIILVDDVTLDSNLTIPTNVTLLIPYDIDDKTGTSIGNADVSRPSWGRGVKPNLTLTINGNGKLVVDGKLIIGAVQHSPNQASQGMTSGAYSQIINDGIIEVNGKMDVRGLITGSGMLTVNDGAELKEPFMVNNYSGGSNTSDLYSANQFPFVQFATANIQCTKVINYGAKVIGSTSLYFWSSVTTQDVVLIDKIENKTSAGEGALIWLHPGSSLEINYSDKAIKEQVGNMNLTESGLNIITVYGTITAGEFYLQSYGSNKMLLSIPYTYNFEIASGATVLIERKYKLMPGSIITIMDGGAIDISETGELIVYNGLIQAPKSGKEYPSATILKKYGFDQVGMLINNGTLNINGRFLGLIQATELTGIVNVGEKADVQSAELVDGSAGSYTDNRTIFTLKAEIYGLYGREELKTGTTYKVYNLVEFVQTEYVMSYYKGNTSSATFIENAKIEINQKLSGRFLEYKDGNYYASVNFSIPEEIEDVQILINGTGYKTKADGTFTAYVNVDNALYSTSFDVEGSYHKAVIKMDEVTTLTEVVKNIILSDSNNYEKVYDKNGNITKEFNFKATVYFYGNVSENIDLTASISEDSYVLPNTKLLSEKYLIPYTKTLYIQPTSISKYVSAYNNLVEAVDLLGDATALYQDYLLLINNRTTDELEYLNSIIKDCLDYKELIVKLTPVSVIYGELSLTLIGTSIDGTTKEVLAETTNYEVNSSAISAIFMYHGLYKDVNYETEVVINNVLLRDVNLTIDDKESIYGDPLLPLTGSMELVNNDRFEDVVELVKAAGNVPGNYEITARRIHPGYNLTVTNGNYTIAKRNIIVKVLDHKDIMKASSNIISDIAISVINSVDENYKLTYELYQDNAYITSIDENGTVKDVLDIGKYIIKPVLTSDCYVMESYELGNIEILIDNTYYDVTVTFNSDGVELEEKTYDGVEVLPLIKVIKHDTGEIVTENISYTLSNGTIIKNAGIYTINVAVNGVEYYNVKTFTINKKTISINIDRSEFVYNGLIQTPNYIVSDIVESDDVFVNAATVTSVNVGNYVIKALGLVGQHAINYNLPENTTAEYDIKQFELDVTIDKINQVYGDPEMLPTFSISTSIPSVDNINNIIKLTKEEGIVVGSYDINGVCINDNYKVNFVGGSKAYQILRRNATVVIDNKTIVYGDDLVSLTAQIFGLVKDDETLSFDSLFTLVKEEGLTAGNYEITGINVSDNYNITFKTAIYQIQQREISVFVDNVTSIYGDEIKDLSYTLTAGTLQFNDTLTSVVRITRESGKNVGSYKIVAEPINDNYSINIDYTNDNYSIYEITRRSVTAEIENAVITNKMVYSEVISSLKYHITKGNLVTNDNLNLEIYLVINDNIIDEANYHKHLCGGLHTLKGRYNNDNYDVTIIDATIEVIKPKISVVNVQNTFIYTGQEIAAFNYVNNIEGYLESATEASFRAWYYLKGDETKSEVKLMNAGIYIMVVEIVHTVSYEFADDAITEFEIEVQKQDISNLITVEGIEEGNYVIINTIKRPFASISSQLDVTIMETLSSNNNAVDEITNLGSYVFKVVIVDDNYKGEKIITFQVIRNIYDTVKQLSDERISMERSRGVEIINRSRALIEKIQNLTEIEKILIENNTECSRIVNEIIARNKELETMYQLALTVENEMMTIYAELNENDWEAKYEIYHNVHPLDEIARSFIDEGNIQKLEIVEKEIRMMLDKVEPTIEAIRHSLGAYSTTSDKAKVLIETRSLVLSLTANERRVVRCDENSSAALLEFEQEWTNYVNNLSVVSKTAEKVQTYQLILQLIMATAVLSTAGLIFKKVLK